MTPKQINDRTDNATKEALEHASGILAENGISDANAFLVVEVAKLWAMSREAVVAAERKGKT